MWLDEKRIRKILDRKLLKVSKNVTSPFFSTIGEDFEIYSLRTKHLLGVFLLSKVEFQRVKEFEIKGYVPFPALYTTQDGRPTAFRFEKSRNVYIKSNTVQNAISLSLGPDSTVILQDHTQKVLTNEIGQLEYKIDLGFLISFGSDIDEFNSYEYLEELIAYAIKSWRQHD